MTRVLPKYAGTLSFAPWSGMKFSEETAELLRKAADKSCPVCEGSGYVENVKDTLIHICHCINRPVQDR